jgi:hypothetical protein
VPSMSIDRDFLIMYVAGEISSNWTGASGRRGIAGNSRAFRSYLPFHPPISQIDNLVCLVMNQRRSPSALDEVLPQHRPEARRAERGGSRRRLHSPAAGKQLFLAPTSLLEGYATMSTPVRRSLPARFASADPFSHAADSAAHCSLHRPASSANGGG